MFGEIELPGVGVRYEFATEVGETVGVIASLPRPRSLLDLMFCPDDVNRRGTL